MRIRMTVWVGRTSTSPRRVTVTTPEECPPDELRSDRLAKRLGDALGVPGDALCVRGRLLDGAALLGQPPLLDGASVRLLERATWAPPRTTSAVAATEIAVTGGPDAGRTRPLTAGAHTVGRVGADLTIGDPTLSRLHLRLDVGPAGMTVTDLGSENGTLLDGEALRDGTRRVGAGAVLRLGHSTLTIRASRGHPVTTTPRGDGTLVVGRSPLPQPEAPAVHITVPARPDPPPPRRVPWPAVLIPLPVAGVLAWLFGPHLLLLAVMSPLMLLGTYLSDRLGARTTYARALTEHALEQATCERQRDDALAAELLWRERTSPDLAAAARAATTPGSLLWSRGDGSSLTIRLGYGPVDSSVTWAEDRSVRRLPLEAAPVTLDLTSYASLALDGPLAERVADAILGQLVVLHPPRDLEVWTDRADWALTPSARVGSAAELVADAVTLLRRRLDRSDGSGRSGRSDGLSTPRIEPIVLLAIDAGSLSGEDAETLIALTRECAGSGVHVLITDGSPSVSAARLHTTATGRAVLTRPGHAPLPLTVDGAGADWVSRISEALAPLRDPGGRSEELPTRVSLSDALARSGVEPTPDGIAREWSRDEDGAWATLGLRPAGAYRLDLASAGPHALIAGTTGSGKSELLRTLVASLAAAHPPENVAVVLVDYKGGSAFAGLEALPHIVGVVTDLDNGLTTRALTSLRAEIRRRERLFAECGATDIADYRTQSRRRGAALPHLARLVIVVDEFRALADELPDFVTGLVRVAAVGRSLGIHLVLATQRPAGVVTADMRANLGLRIALRVRDRADAQDVIESDAAASLPRAIPGRGLVRCATEPLVAFQTATVDPNAAAEDLTIETTWSDGTATTRHYPLTPTTGPPDLVAAIAAAARSGTHRAPPSPWLAPLPDRLEWRATDPPAAWAVRDDPAHQSQDPVSLDPAAMPHTAVAGAIGSGRSTTLLALVSAALAAQGERTHLYVLADPTGPLAALTDLPHTGALVDRTDPAQLADVVDRLAAEVRARQSAPTQTLLLVVIDGWDVLADACDALDHCALTDRLLATLREGYALGLRAVVAGDRSVLTGRVGRTLPERILLRPADGADLALAGISPLAAPAHWPPGRAIRVGDQAELQVLLRWPDRGPVPAPATSPWRVTRLPARIDHTALPAPRGGRIPIGPGSESTEPITIGRPGCRRVLVLGSAGGGRTSTLALIGVQATRTDRRVCVVGEDHSALVERLHQAQVCVEQLGWDAQADLVGLHRAHPDLVVLADDVDRHAESPLVSVLSQIADLAERDGGLIAVAGDGAALAMRSRGIGAAVARGRVGIVLGAPTPLDGDLLGTRLPRIRAVTPGRGWFIAARRAVPIQVACLDPATPVPSGPSSPPRRR